MKSIYTIVIVVLLLVVPNVSFAASQTFTSSGTFTVPLGVSSVSALIIGAGGGGGGSYGHEDTSPGGGGGSGGYYFFNNVAVSSGQVITVTVGTGGLTGSYVFNGNILCQGSNFHTITAYGLFYLPSFDGSSGGNSSISGAFGTLSVTGGQGGIGIGATYNYNIDSGISGVGGTPNGVAGGAVPYVRNDYPPTPGGWSPFGSGGGSGNGGNPTICPTGGQNGTVVLVWTPPPSVFLQFSFLDRAKSILSDPSHLFDGIGKSYRG